MSDLVVYSCVTGDYDNIVETIVGSEAESAPNTRYVLFHDKARLPYKLKSVNTTWDVKPLSYTGPCRRRTARWHKVNSHVLFPDASFTLWIDGTQRFLPGVNPYRDIVLPTEADSLDIFTFKHPERTCVYQELKACCRLKKDNELLMQQQVERYRKNSYPPYNGMVETACVLRRKSVKVNTFNREWWSELARHSFRDQLSFNYVAWSLSIGYGTIPGCRARSDYFQFVPHAGG